MLRPSLVDLKVQRFTQWKQSLEQEDLIECGTVIERTDKELMRMYSSYRKFQHSPEVGEARAKLRKEQE